MKETNIQFRKDGYNSEYDVYCSQYHARQSYISKYFSEMEMTFDGILNKSYKWEIYQIQVFDKMYWKKQKKLISIQYHSEPS